MDHPIRLQEAKTDWIALNQPTSPSKAYVSIHQNQPRPSQLFLDFYYYGRLFVLVYLYLETKKEGENTQRAR